MRERSLFGKHSMLDAEEPEPKVKKLKKKKKKHVVADTDAPLKKKKKKKKRPDDRYMDEFVQERTKAEARSEVKKKAKKRIREIVKAKQESISDTGTGFKQLPVFSSTGNAQLPATAQPVVSAVLGGLKPRNQVTTQPTTVQATAQQSQVACPVSTPATAGSSTSSSSAPTPSNPSSASKLYYADLPLHDRVFKLAQDGQTNDQIAIRLGVSIKQVMDIRKEITTKSLIGNPRDLFARRLKNFEDCFDTMLQVFDEDPTNEVAGKSLTDFMKEMRELTTAYRDIDDPQEVAKTIVNTAIRPMVMKMLKAIVDGVNATAKNVTPYLRESEKQMVNDGLRNSLKSLQDNVNDTYNASVLAIAQLYDVDLTGLLIKKEFRASQSEDPT